MVVVNPGKLIVEIRHHRQQAGFCSSFFSLFSFTLIHDWIYIPMVEFMPSIGVGSRVSLLLAPQQNKITQHSQTALSPNNNNLKS